MSALSIPGVLNICVQSKMFYVSRELIEKHKDNFFLPLLPGNWAEKQNNIIFVDRDPKIFKHILDFLCEYPLDVECPSNTFDRLCIDAKFYMFTELIKILDGMKIIYEENCNLPEEYHDCTLEDMIQKITNHRGYDDLEDYNEPKTRTEAFAIIKTMDKQEQDNKVKLTQIVFKSVFNTLKPTFEKNYGMTIDFSSSEINAITLELAKYLHNAHSKNIPRKRMYDIFLPVAREVVKNVMENKHAPGNMSDVPDTLQ